MIGIKEFKIEKPEYQRSYFLTSIIKYFVLAFVSWMCCIAFALMAIGRKDNSDFSFKFAFVLGTIAVFFIWFRFFLKKYKLSDIYKIIIDYDKKIITFLSINMHTGKELKKEIAFSNFTTKMRFNNHSLYGEQNILVFYENSKLYNVLNIELTAWNRLDNIEEVIETLKTFSPNK